MDILKEIESQITQIKRDDNSAYLDQIFNHLDRAETYYKQGKEDQHYFNDVIYRSNQAYEGALKEAYKILASKTENELTKTTLFDIENHLANNNIFKSRVLQLFEKYRKEWRNPATHDYNLIFDENEAFIALTNVSSFVHLLLKQIQERIAFKIEQERLQQDQETLDTIQRIVEIITEPLPEKVLKLLKDFSERNEPVLQDPMLLEIELLGMLHGFLSQASEDLIIDREPKIEVDNELLRPDFILQYMSEYVILEVKRSVQVTPIRTSRMKGYIDQMIRFLISSNVSSGIIFFLKTVDGAFAVNHEKHEFTVDGQNFNIYIVTT